MRYYDPIFVILDQNSWDKGRKVKEELATLWTAKMAQLSWVLVKHKIK